MESSHTCLPKLYSIAQKLKLSTLHRHAGEGSGSLQAHTSYGINLEPAATVLASFHRDCATVLHRDAHAKYFQNDIDQPRLRDTSSRLVTIF